MLLNTAIQLAARAHDGQTDKGGNPYILHPLRVMMACAGEAEMICAVLHDVVEDTDVTLNELARIGFPDEVLRALDCLTKRAGESYDEFIERVLQNRTACRVKLADLNDNMDLSRLQEPSEKDLERVRKYRLAADRIARALGEL